MSYIGDGLPDDTEQFRGTDEGSHYDPKPLHTGKGEVMSQSTMLTAVSQEDKETFDAMVVAAQMHRRLCAVAAWDSMEGKQVTLVCAAAYDGVRVGNGDSMLLAPMAVLIPDAERWERYDPQYGESGAEQMPFGHMDHEAHDRVVQGWTTDFPTEEGFYWTRIPAEQVSIDAPLSQRALVEGVVIRVTRQRGILWVVTATANAQPIPLHVFTNELGAEFQGPIPVPK